MFRINPSVDEKLYEPKHNSNVAGSKDCWNRSITYSRPGNIAIYRKVEDMKNSLLTKEETKKDELAQPRRESPFFMLQKEMNRLFDDFGHGRSLLPMLWHEPFGEFHAKIDVKDTEKEVVITCELPGIDPKDVEVTLRQDSITIKGEKKEEKEEKENGYYRMERSYGSFHRTLPLPFGIDRDKATANTKDGVMKITLPKTGESLKAEKKIDVNKA